jgi:hypothetical protein
MTNGKTEKKSKAKIEIKDAKKMLETIASEKKSEKTNEEDIRDILKKLKVKIGKKREPEIKKEIESKEISEKETPRIKEETFELPPVSGAVAPVLKSKPAEPSKSERLEDFVAGVPTEKKEEEEKKIYEFGKPGYAAQVPYSPEQKYERVEREIVEPRQAIIPRAQTPETFFRRGQPEMIEERHDKEFKEAIDYRVERRELDKAPSINQEFKAPEKRVKKYVTGR